MNRFPFFFLLLFFIPLLSACQGNLLPWPEPKSRSIYVSDSYVPSTDFQNPSTEDNPVDLVVVQKRNRTLSLWKNSRLIKTFSIMAMGANPVGQKVYEGDERTPEGQYYISRKHVSQNFQKFLGISYPNEKDKILAQRFGLSPGGNVGIHGDSGGELGAVQRTKSNWTDGCIAMRNNDIEQIYELVAVGTPILIKP